MAKLLCDTLVVGGGVTGIFAALAASYEPWSRVALVERADELGGVWGMSAVQYLHKTATAMEFLERHGIGYEARPVRAGVLYDFNDGNPRFADLCRAGCLADQVEDLQELHYEKSRGSLDGFDTTTMNDFGRTGSEALDFDLEDAIKLLRRRVKVFTGFPLHSILSGGNDGGPSCIFMGGSDPGSMEVRPADLVLTVPFGKASPLKDTGGGSKVRYQTVLSPLGFERRIGNFNYLYTVDTPSDAVFRISRMNGAPGRWLAESRSDIPEERACADIEALFGPEAIVEKALDIDTRVIAVDDGRDEKPRKGIIRIGRAATNDPRWLLHNTIDAISKL